MWLAPGRLMIAAEWLAVCVAVAAVCPVGVAASGLGQTAADHVADGQQRDVQPHLVAGEVIGSAILALNAVAGDENADQNDEKGVELGCLERRLGLGGQSADGIATGTVCAAAGDVAVRGVITGCHRASLQAVVR